MLPMILEILVKDNEGHRSGTVDAQMFEREGHFAFRLLDISKAV
jgi:hypothetical protein